MKEEGAYSNNDVIQEEVLTMITADYRGKRGIQNGQKSDVVISEQSLTTLVFRKSCGVISYQLRVIYLP